MTSYLGTLLRDPCAYCGAPVEHLDHIEPRSKGGSDDFDNVIGACAPCNREKRAQSLLMFMLSRFAVLSPVEQMQRTVGMNLATARQALGVSQRLIAADLGVGINTVSRWEKGRNAPRAQHLEALADILGQPLAWFFTEREADEVAA